MEAIYSSVGQPKIQKHTAFLREENNMIYENFYFIARKDAAHDNKENHICNNPAESLFNSPSGEYEEAYIFQSKNSVSLTPTYPVLY